MTVAYVLSGGASLGAIQVGMAQALDERGISPDLVVGTSVGALNGAYLAGGGTPAAMQDIWLGLERPDLFPIRPKDSIRALLGQQPYMVGSDGVRGVLETYVPFERLEDATVPFTALATDAQTGAEVRLSTGPAVEAILASAALPGILPPVEWGDRMLIDGGIANNTPITAAIDAGATEVWVLSTGYACALPAPPSHPLALAIHSIGLLIQQRLARETQNKIYPVPVRLIPPPCPMDVGPLDFSQSGPLIHRALIGTRQWLEDGMPLAQPLTLGHHHWPVESPHHT